MWLLNVRAVLDRERDIQLAEPKTKVLEQHDDKTAKYAILSHRWGKEIDYDEMTGLLKMDKQDRDAVRRRDGYQKILKSCKQADDDGYEWLWIDTCCIDKRSSAELSEAINSMYRWYRNSQICYVYLNDVSEPAFPAVQDFMRFPESNGWPEWFSRGWTLQELIAPTKLKFFNKSWELIGTKEGLTSTLQDITRIPEEVLKDAQVLRSIDSSERPRTAQIMAWAADRTTTRVEDRAYSLLGLFGVNMPMLYGEGSKAFQRLQLEIIRISSDHSIFAWNPKREFRQSGSVLAAGPSSFQGCHNIENVHRKEFVNGVKAYMGKSGFHVNSNYYTPMEAHVNSPQFSIFNVTNVGIQVSLPVIPHRGASDGHFKAILPCRDRLGNLITIDLEPHGLNSCRSFWAIRIADDTWPGFTSFYLNFSREGDADESYHDLRLDDWHTSWHGFTRRGTFPSEVSDNTVTLSPGNNLIVLVYVNNDARSRFAVGIGYCLGRVWTHVSSDESRAKEGVLSSWTDFAMQTYDVLWNTPIHEFYRNIRNTVRDAHIPRSIWDARIACRSSDQGYTDVMIGVKWCPGCCTGPREFTHTSLSDHGHPFDGSFNSRSNISRDMREVRINDWHRGLACEQRRKRYQNIRGHFDALAELLPYRFVGTKACDESVENLRRMNKEINISAMFGLEYLRNWVGEIQFFGHFPPEMETSRAAPLLKRCTDVGKGLLHEKRKTQSEVISMSQTLSVGVPKYIRTTLLDASEGNQRTGQADYTDYNQANFRSVVKEIEALQAILQATEDEAEQLSLEEDITGKILWFYWCGICSEVDQLLAKVMNSEAISDVPTRRGLREIAEIVKKTQHIIGLDDDMAHMQRIMLDARAGISRHELWLAAQDGESQVIKEQPTLGT